MRYEGRTILVLSKSILHSMPLTLRGLGVPFAPGVTHIKMYAKSAHRIIPISTFDKSVPQMDCLLGLLLFFPLSWLLSTLWSDGSSTTPPLHHNLILRFFLPLLHFFHPLFISHGAPTYKPCLLYAGRWWWGWHGNGATGRGAKHTPHGRLTNKEIPHQTSCLLLCSSSAQCMAVWWAERSAVRVLRGLEQKCVFTMVPL